MVTVDTDFLNDLAGTGYITEILNTANTLIEQEEIVQLIQWFYPKIADALKNYEQVVEFCEEGGIEKLCKIIELVIQKTEYFYILIPLLEEFSLLSSISHPSYDDHIGDLPILTYFLTERDRFYIDINWKHQEMSLMNNFCRLHLELISNPRKYFVNNYTDGFALAISNLAIAVSTYPQHRVTPAVAELFNYSISSKIIKSLMENCTFKNPITSSEVSNLICSILALGLGLGFVEDLPTHILLMASQNVLNLGLRCPCECCELSRKLRKVAIYRDEFGIPAAYQANKRIPQSFLTAKGLGILEILIRELVSTHFIESEYKWPIFDDDIKDNLKCKYRLGIKSASLSLLISFLYLEETHFKSAQELKTILNIVAFVIQQVTNICALNPHKFFDVLKNEYFGINSLLTVTEYICLRLFSYNPELLINNFKKLEELALSLSKSILKIDPKIDVKPLTLGMNKGIPLLQLYFLLKNYLNMRRSSPILNLQEENAQEKSYLRPFESNLFTNDEYNDDKNYVERSPCIKTDDQNSSDSNKISTIFEPDYDFVQSCSWLYSIIQSRKLDNSYENYSHSLISNLLIYMASITDVRNINFLPELRKRFYKPPKVQCGWMANVLRNLGTNNSKDEHVNIKCSLNRKLAQLVVSQAERASALAITQ